MTTNVEKRIVLASADPLSHMELELTSAIQEAYEKAVKEGFKGSISDWIKTSPIDEVKKINLKDGGEVVSSLVKKMVKKKKNA